jgi:DNA polymerase
MISRQSLSDFWVLLDLAEDQIQAGYRREHAPPPQRLVAAAAPAAPVAAAARSPQETAPVVADSLERVAAEVLACTRCPLHNGRSHAVPGEGVSRPLVLVVGEGPGAEEDRTGRPFVGPAGRYLDAWLAATTVGGEPLSRSVNAYIANVVKCRPPGNRDPQPDEAAACIGYLRRQIALLQPRAILAVGRTAARHLLGIESGVGAARGRSFDFESIPALVTYHPSAVLRDAALKRPVWEDLKRLRGLLENG